METQEDRALQNEVDALKAKLTFERHQQAVVAARLEGEAQGLRTALQFALDNTEPKEYNHE